jgi:hypothetical protein
MSTVLKNTTAETVDIPTLGVVVEPGRTVEIPDELADSLVESFSPTRAKSADIVPDPEVVDQVLEQRAETEAAAVEAVGADTTPAASPPEMPSQDTPPADGTPGDSQPTESA